MTVIFLQNCGIFLQQRNLRQFSSQPSIHRQKKSDDLGALVGGGGGGVGVQSHNCVKPNSVDLS